MTMTAPGLVARTITSSLIDRTRGNGHKLKHSRYPLHIRKHFVTVRVTQHWHRLPREAVECPSLEILKSHLDAAQLHSQFSLPPPPTSGTGGRGMEVAGRTPHTLPLLQRGVPAMGDSPPRTSPTWVLPTGCSSSPTAPAWVPFMGCSPSGTDCSSVGPPWGHKSCQQTCSSMGSSLHGSRGPARSLLQCGLPTGSQPPSGIHLLWRGVLHGLQVDICSTMDLHRLQEDSLPHQGLHQGLQGNLCSAYSSVLPTGEAEPEKQLNVRPSDVERKAELGLFSLEKRRLQEDLIAAFQYIKWAYKKDGEILFTMTCSNRTRGNDFTLKES
ncbi:hypothetical protein QYF61_026878 [Mycteria americana]|uniref:Uncharacterized protein n=1 Tax=Mycteria americana TaxID=33587 RepID=A0AAN7NFN1_MYCAM|nr:hypothetical protein QYF61_026878 [Mycteria americana]